jgi:hypothetical protein
MLFSCFIQIFDLEGDEIIPFDPQANCEVRSRTTKVVMSPKDQEPNDVDEPSYEYDNFGADTFTSKFIIPT